MRGYICNIKVKLEYDLESSDCDYLLKKVLFSHIFLSKSTPTPLFNKFWVHDYLCDSCFYTHFYKLCVV